MDRFLSPIEDVIEDAQNGRMFILVDEEDRENEGDLCIPAQMATPDAVNFMAKHGRGLICLAMEKSRVDHLGLPLMASQNQARHETAFTASIEAREGVTTGISAHDRSRTIGVAIDPTKNSEDIVMPGHVFPLVARDGGVLVRAGHTEAVVDISRLAGLNPSGVICEIMNDDGTMARLPDLIKFAQFHGLKVATIADLIAYRRRHDNSIRRATETTFVTDFGGEFKMIIYINTAEYAEHIVLVKGDISGPEPVLTRVHAINVLDDVLGRKTSRFGQLHDAMRLIAEEGRGVIVIIRDARTKAVTELLKREMGDAPHPPELREYGIGAQILLDLGIQNMTLLTNTHHTIVGLDGYGLTVAGERPIRAAAAE